jgi:hypothetical protein
LLENLELVASDSVERLAKSANQPGMIGSAFGGDNVTIGLKQHEAFSIRA